MNNIINQSVIDLNRYGYIYRITNINDGRTYIGKHKISKNEKWTTYMGSGRLITIDVRDIGIKNFKKEIICYCDGEKELIQNEDKFIFKEVLKGKSEYNIAGTDKKGKPKLKYINITDEELLNMYFDQQMSGREIDKKLGLSPGTVYDYLSKKYKETDSRFSEVGWGVIRNPETRKRVNENLKNGTEASHVRVKCQYCTNEKDLSSLKRHEVSCEINPNRLPSLCIIENCKDRVLNKNVSYCIKHLEDKNIEITPSQKAGHKRYHIDRNIITEFCSLCIEYKKENNINFLITKEKLQKDLLKELNYKQIALKYGVKENVVFNWVKILNNS